MQEVSYRKFSYVRKLLIVIVAALFLFTAFPVFAYDLNTENEATPAAGIDPLEEPLNSHTNPDHENDRWLPEHSIHLVGAFAILGFLVFALIKQSLSKGKQLIDNQ